MENKKCGRIRDNDYTGPERRKVADGRRKADECIWHEAHEERFLSNERKISAVCRACENLKSAVDGITSDVSLKVDTRTPLKLFYGTAAGVIAIVLSILAFQWTTYERVGKIGLEAAKTMGQVQVKLTEIDGNVSGNQLINTMRDDNMERSIEQHLKNSEKALDKMQKSIDKVETLIKNGNHKTGG